MANLVLHLGGGVKRVIGKSGVHPKKSRQLALQEESVYVIPTSYDIRQLDGISITILNET